MGQVCQGQRADLVPLAKQTIGGMLHGLCAENEPNLCDQAGNPVAKNAILIVEMVPLFYVGAGV